MQTRGAEPGVGDAFMVLVQRYMAERKLTRGQAIRAVVHDWPEAHSAYLEQVNGGRA